MILQQGEYEISEDGEKITITKKCLEELRDLCSKTVKDYSYNTLMSWMYMGEYNVLCEILKMFEQLEG